MDRRWTKLNELLLHTSKKILVSSDMKQFSDELTSLREILVSYEKWVATEEKVADEALEISRQLEQCRVRPKKGKLNNLENWGRT